VFLADRDKPPGEEERDLGLAMVAMAHEPHPDKVRAIIGRHAAALLAQAVGQNPEDVAAWEALGFARWAAGNPSEALAALETALAKSPRREEALRVAVRAAAQLGRADAATGFARRLLEVNPWGPSDHYELAKILADRRHWKDAARECRAVLRLEPEHVPARLVLVACLIQSGRRAQARAQFEVLMALDPPQADRLRRWFAEQTK
jgi:tetratricopeptide (TPR) repeat protein